MHSSVHVYTYEYANMHIPQDKTTEQQQQWWQIFRDKGLQIVKWHE